MTKLQKGSRAIACLWAILPGLALAQEAQPIDIPAQPLAEAIAELGRETGLQVGMRRDLTENRTSAPVSGVMTAREALQTLLRGTGLSAMSLGADGEIVTTPDLVSQNAVDEPFELETLLITGERFSASVFDTESSVTVTTAEDLEDTPAIRDVNDVLERTPNVLILPNTGLAPTVRGIGSAGALSGAGAFAGGTLPRTTLSVDGRPLSYNELANGINGLFDVERVEVFTGPQTTAQGSNSIAGAFFVETKDPTFDPEGVFAVEAGQNNRRRASFAYSAPVIADELAIRFSYDRMRRDAYVENAPEIPGFDVNRYESQTARLKILWEPLSLPELSTKLTLSLNENTEPQAERVVDPVEDRQSVQDIVAGIENRALSVVHELDYEFAPGLSLSNTLVYADVDYERFTNFEGGGQAESNRKEFRNEALLRFSGADQRLKGLVGIAYARTEEEQDIDLSAFLGLGAFDDTRESLGVFGEVNYQFDERWDATLGLRYQRESQDRKGNLGIFLLDYDETFDAILPKIAFGYKVSEDLRVGAQLSKGFNPGGTTISFATGEVDEFDEETVWNYELFVRGAAYGGRLQYNANLFYSDYRDFQRDLLTGFDPTGNPQFEVANVARARSYGLELGFDAVLTDRLRAAGTLGLLNTEVTDGAPAADPDSIEGKSFANSPDVTATLGLDYDATENLTLGLRWRFVDSFFSQSDEAAGSEIDSHSIVDLNGRFAIGAGTLKFGVTNVFDEAPILQRFATGPNSFASTVGAPREFSVSYDVAF